MKLPFFGKKKKAEESKGRGYVPTDRTRELMGKGFSELDTIDVLRREGFSPTEIDGALTQSVKEGVTGGGRGAGRENATRPQPEASKEFEQSYQEFKQRKKGTFPPKKEQTPEAEPAKIDLPTIEDLQKQDSVQMPAMPETSLPEEYYQDYPTEEYIDYVVQERTQDVMDKINEFAIRNRELEMRLKEMSERVSELSKIRGSEQQRVIIKIEELSDSLMDVNTRMASLEKAFKETLPALIESVRSLSDLVQRLKREA